MAPNGISASDKIVFWLFLLPFGIIIWLMVFAAIAAAAMSLWGAA